MEISDYSRLNGAPVTNEDGEKLGKIEGLFVDDELNVPTWVAVRSGFFGNDHSLVPLAESKFVDGELLVPYSKDDLSIAPHHDPGLPLTVAEEEDLFAHYSVGYEQTDRPGPHTGVDAVQTGLTGSPDAGSHPVDLAEADVEIGAAVAATPHVDGVPGLPTTKVERARLRLRRYDRASR